jgi:hypothetical protein
MALTPAVIDVSLSPTVQTTSDTMGPLGQLRTMINGQIRRYEPHFQGAQGVVPSKIRVEPRDAFNSLPATSRSVVDGAPASPSWSQQRLLAELDEQLVSICGGSLPRVFDGSNWRAYPNNAVLTQKLAQEVLHTSQRTIQAPDSAWMNGVTCAVWTESTPATNGALTTTYVGFKADNGTWLVQPSALFSSVSVTNVTNARVVQDGTHFWVFHSTTVSGIAVGVYDINGALLNTFFNVAPPLHSWGPNAWDVVAANSAGGYTVLVAVLTDGTSDAGVTFTALKISGSTITQNIVAVPAIHAEHGLGFLTNDTGNGLTYLATSLPGSFQAIWAYEITNQAVTHTYNTGVTENTNTVDSLTGYVVSGSLAVVVSYSVFITFAQAVGPKYDPQRRYMTSFQTDRSNVTTQLRTTQSLAQSSRAFAVDGNYYSLGYYQSGSGSVLVQTKETVTIEAGDSMIGAATQPIAVRSTDAVFGSPVHATEAVSPGGSITVFVSSAKTSTPVLIGDTASPRTALNMSQWGIPDGTPLLLWSLANLTAGINNYGGSRFVINAGGLNTTFEVLGTLDATIGSTQFYTLQQDSFGNGVGHIVFPGGGNFSMTSLACYLVSDLSTFVPDDDIARGVFVESNGTIVVSGASGSGNNGTFQIQRIRSPLGSAGSSAAWPASPIGISPTYTFGNNQNAATTSQVWVTRVSQTQETAGAGFTAVINPSSTPNNWFFGNGAFDSSYVGADLVIASDVQVPSNVGMYPITSVTASNDLVTAGATSLISQFFEIPFPGASIHLTTQVNYTFTLQSLTLDYTYQNAIVLVQGAANPNNNGTYRITQINPDGPGTFIAEPTNGLSNQVNEAFTGAQTITIFFAPNNQPTFQSTWFIVPLTGSQPVAGRFEYGLAYADWRFEGDLTAGPTLFPGCIV